MSITRREFIQTTAAALAAARLPQQQLQNRFLGFGYAAITWNGNDRQAMDDISELGFKGIQLRSNIVPQFWKAPELLTDRLARRNLGFVALSSGPVSVDPARKREMLTQHMTNARFLRDANGRVLQLTDEKPKDRAVKPGDLGHLAELLTTIAERASNFGVTVAYHPHMGTLGETPEAVDKILNMSGNKVKLLLDVAHWTQGGGNPVEAIRKYHDRLGLVHLKDVANRVPIGKESGYQFVELGKGRVDLKGVLRELSSSWDGWVVVELDAVPDKTRTPKDCAIVNKAYLTGLGYMAPLK